MTCLQCYLLGVVTLPITIAVLGTIYIFYEMGVARRQYERRWRR